MGACEDWCLLVDGDWARGMVQLVDGPLAFIEVQRFLIKGKEECVERVCQSSEVDVRRS